jgi:hypothetical protein
MLQDQFAAIALRMDPNSNEAQAQQQAVQEARERNQAALLNGTPLNPPPLVDAYGHFIPTMQERPWGRKTNCICILQLFLFQDSLCLDFVLTCHHDENDVCNIIGIH